jgi:hypothetical protein
MAKTPKRNTFSVSKLAKAVVLAAVGASAAAIFAFYKEDVAVRVANWVVKGELAGDWVLYSFEYERGNANPRLIPLETTAELKHFGFRVIGDLRSVKKSWNLAGYYNQTHLALAVVSAGGTSGLATITVRALAQGNLALAGTVTGVDCKGLNATPVLLSCPMLLVRKEHGELKDTYRYFLNSESCKEFSFELPDVSSKNSKAPLCEPSPKSS